MNMTSCIKNLVQLPFYFLLLTTFFVSYPLTSLDDQIEQITEHSATQGYNPDFIELIEMVYGKGFLSQGARESVQEMLEDLDLTGLKVLDIGSGIGGPCLYLAENYNCEIIGLEPQEWMVEKAKNYLHDSLALMKGSLNFIHMKKTSNLELFADNSFDVILSRETFLHIPKEAKPSFFSEIYRVLKPNGKLIIVDWLHQTPNYSESTKQMMKQDGLAYHLLSPQEYKDLLSNSGFIQIEMKDTTCEHVDITDQNIRSVEALKATIETKYEHQTYEQSLDSWSAQKKAFEARELLTYIFNAKK